MLKALIYTLSTFTLLAASIGQAHAGAIDLPAQVCKKEINSTGTINFDSGGVRNDSTAALTVVCPISLKSASNRDLYIGGTDNNSSVDFSCTAFGWDANLATVSMPSITITSGTYSNGTVGSFSIPNSVAKLVIRCTIPGAPTFVSSLSDFWVQW